MRLMEYQGKELLTRHGIPVPAGALWPARPNGAGGPLVAKAQVLAGGRGKRGGIQFVDRPEDVAGVVAGLLGTTLGPEKVDSLYVPAPMERLHTGWDGAVINAEQVIAGLKQLDTNPLAPFLAAEH